MDEDRYLLGADLVGTVVEDEEHRVDDVALSASVGSDYRVETLETNMYI